MTQSPNEQAAPAEVWLTWLDVVQVLARESRKLVFWPLAIGVVFVALSFLVHPKFTATTTLMPPKEEESAAALLAGQFGALAGLPELPAAAGLVKSASQGYLTMLESDRLVGRVVEAMGLEERYGAPNMFYARRALRDRSEVVHDQDSDLILIRVTDPSPDSAALIANEFFVALEDVSRELAVTEAAKRRLFLERRMEAARDVLGESEDALAADPRFGSGDGYTSLIPGLNIQKTAELEAEITTLEVRLNSLRATYANAHPAVRAIMADLQALEAQKAEMESSALMLSLSDSTRGGDYFNAFREYEYQRSLVEALGRQVEIARAEEASEGAVLQVLDYAEPPIEKSSPRRALIGIVTSFSIFTVLAFLALMREMLGRATADPKTAAVIRRISDDLRGLKSNWLRGP